jgi:hypothetical protein
MKSGHVWQPGLLICAFAMLAFSADIYVSPTGNDAAAGTSTAPLATLAAARDKADQLKATNPPVTVYLHGGTYYLSAPVVFGAANSGTATAPIVYKAVTGEKPVLSGGIKVTSAWTASSGSIMVTTIATNLKVDQLFLNGTRQVLARFPNFNAATVILDGYDANCLSRVGNWANPGEGPGYIRGLHVNQWGGNSYIITGKTGTTLNQTWVGDNNRGSGLDATHRMVENIYEELDAAGEWFYRKSTGQLFFWPPTGTNLSTATVELASQDELLRFVGSASGTAGSVKYIQFNGIAFTHTFRTLFSKPYEMVLKSDWGIARAGTVFMQNAENIVIQNCLFDQVGGNGVFMSGYNRKHVVYNNVFNDAGASCVALLGLTSSIRCPNSWSGTPACNDRTPGPVDPVNGEFPAYVRIDNNMMNHFGRFEKQPAGIALSGTLCDTLRHNTIHDCPRAGICFCSGCWGGHVVEYNWVYNDVLETGDHGPFNAWGRDRNERWSTDTTATTLDAWKTTIVRNNRFESKQGNFGIDLDDQASNYLQYYNLLLGGGMKLQWNRYNTYLNNVLVNGADVQMHGVWHGSQDYVAHNIFTASQTYYIGFFNHVPATSQADSVHLNTRMIDSNCVQNTNVNTESGGVTWAQWTQRSLDVHSATGDPQFTDVNKTWPNYTPKGDYTVKSSSPALTVGFKNFPMDSFGVMPVVMCTGAGCGDPIIERIHAIDGLEKARCIVNYRAGRLIVSHDGEYQLTITTASGRTVRAFNGKGNSCYAINSRMFGSGVYIFAVYSAKGVITQKFLVN